MKISIFTTALILIACIANAGNIDGKWEGFSGPYFTFTFKADGKKLTGTTLLPRRGTFKYKNKPIDIQNGKIEGNKISFEVPVKTSWVSVTIFFTGELSGDELKLSSKRKVEVNPDSKLEIEAPEGDHSHPPPQTTLICKRVKNGE